MRHSMHDRRERADHTAMLIEMRQPWLWTNFTVMILGLWLLTSPRTFGYTSAAMTWSDTISGVLLMVCAGVSLIPSLRGDFFGRWGACFVGVWLQLAPLIFHAPDAAAYLNNTLVGAFVIAFTILVPMMPGHAHHMAMMKPGPTIPPGWSYNPASWHQRAPLVGLAVIGWFISRYLAARQLGHIEWAWDPFFGDGSEKVLFSDVSEAFPVSDAGLGAAAYTFEALMALMGSERRWRTMPWMVLLFGILVVPLGVTHIVLVILMPVMVGEWCTLCLAAATVMLIMIPLAVDEVVVMFQFIVQARREGKSLWRTFWVGDTLEAAPETDDQRTPRFGGPVAGMFGAATWGVSLPWALVAVIAMGLWTMFAPAAFGIEGQAANSNYVTGAMIITVAGIATAEVVRTVRFMNVPLGLWLAAAPFLLSGGTTGSMISNVAIGLLVIALSLPRGKVLERYGPWERYIV